jgi:Divergent CRAL/TRIO domain
MKNIIADLDIRSHKFMKLAISPTAAMIDDGEKAFEYICKLVGQVPTPVGNPFSIVAFSTELDKEDYFSAIIYLLTAIPALGTIGAAISKAGFIKQGSWILAKSALPSGFKARVLRFLITFYQSQSWVETARKSFISALLSTKDGTKLKAYSKKVGVESVENMNQLAGDIANKVVSEISSTMNNMVIELGKILNTIP